MMRPNAARAGSTVLRGVRCALLCELEARVTKDVCAMRFLGTICKIVLRHSTQYGHSCLYREYTDRMSVL